MSELPVVQPASDYGFVAPSPLHQGRRLVEVIEATLTAGEKCITDWNDLEPIVKALVARFREHVEKDKATMDVATATRLLDSAARTIDKLAKASQSFLRSADGLTRCGVLLQGGVPERTDPNQLTEKQMVNVVIETAKRIRDERGECPVCGATTTTVDADVVIEEPA